MTEQEKAELERLRAEMAAFTQLAAELALQGGLEELRAWLRFTRTDQATVAVRELTAFGDNMQLLADQASAKGNTVLAAQNMYCVRAVRSYAEVVMAEIPAPDFAALDAPEADE